MKFGGWNLDITADVHGWALPLLVVAYPGSLSVVILCVEFSARRVGPPLSPEDELRYLNQYADEVLGYIAEERAELMARMGDTVTK